MLSRFAAKSPLAPAEHVASSEAPGSLPVPLMMVIDDHVLALKVRLHQRLIDEINLPVIEKMPRQQFEKEVGDLIRDMLSRETSLLNERERKQFVIDILDELLGLGPLEPLLKDESVSD